MGLLDGGLQQMFGAAFGTLLLEGRHYQNSQTFAANGDVSEVVIKTQSVKGYREITNDRMRALGYSDRDARLLILQTYQSRAITAPKRDDIVLMDGLRWVCGDIDEDAAHTHWIIKATRE